jgi:hypothetical protein
MEEAEPALQATRRAAYALNMICKEIGLGTLAIVWRGDDPSQWGIQSIDEVVALDNGRKAAHIYLDGDLATVHVEDCHSLIRGEHLREFEPGAYGIIHDTRMDWRGDKLVNDIEAEAIDTSKTPGLKLPRLPIDRANIRHSVKVIPSRG